MEGSIFPNEDIKLVKKSLNSDIITQGAYVDLFESKLRNYFKSKYSLRRIKWHSSFTFGHVIFELIKQRHSGNISAVFFSIS